jgi:hypothetical protein
MKYTNSINAINPIRAKNNKNTINISNFEDSSRYNTIIEYNINSKNIFIQNLITFLVLFFIQNPFLFSISYVNGIIDDNHSTTP